MLDEAHQRGQDEDMLFTAVKLLRRQLEARRAHQEHAPVAGKPLADDVEDVSDEEEDLHPRARRDKPFQLLVMSATLDVDVLSQYFSDTAAIIDVGAKKFPVQEFFAGDLLRAGRSFFATKGGTTLSFPKTAATTFSLGKGKGRGGGLGGAAVVPGSGGTIPGKRLHNGDSISWQERGYDDGAKHPDRVIEKKLCLSARALECLSRCAEVGAWMGAERERKQQERAIRDEIRRKDVFYQKECEGRFFRDIKDCPEQASSSEEDEERGLYSVSDEEQEDCCFDLDDDDETRRKKIQQEEAKLPRDAHILVEELVSKLATPGESMLVFLPGMKDLGEIFAHLNKRLVHRAAEDDVDGGALADEDDSASSAAGAGCKDVQRFQVYLLHSQTSADLEREVSAPVPGDCFRVILASSIAENSLTMFTEDISML